MSRDAEFGTCPVCGQETQLNRTYFKYDLKCECHSPQHFEIAWHCNYCEPIEPGITKIIIKTKNLIKI